MIDHIDQDIRYKIIGNWNTYKSTAMHYKMKIDVLNIQYIKCAIIKQCSGLMSKLGLRMENNYQLKIKGDKIRLCDDQSFR